MVATKTPVFMAALKLIEFGYPVFPCGGPDGKKPKTEHGFKDATLDEKQAWHWWGVPKVPPNIAVPTDGLFVVDHDVLPGGKPNPWPGDPSRKLDLERGPCAKTPRGGRHYWFADHDQLYRNSTSEVAPHVDIRATGGYVVVPPSVGPAGAYEWLSELRNRDELPPIPAWLVPSLKPAPQSAGTTGTATRVASDNGRGRGCDNDLSVILAEGSPEGRRHADAVRLAGHYLGREHPLSEHETLVQLRDWNTRCRPSLGGPELARLVADIAKKEQAKKAGVATMEPEQAMALLAEKFSWLPDPLAGVEQSVARAGFETYLLVLESGKRVKLGPVGTVLSAAKANQVFAVEFRMQIPASLRKTGSWSAIADIILRAAVVQDTTFSPEEEMREWLRSYCENTRRGDEYERLHKAGWPYIHDGEVRVQATELASWLWQTKSVKYSRYQVCDLLAALGMPRRSVFVRDPDPPHKMTGRSYCCGPESVLSTDNTGSTTSRKKRGEDFSEC